MTKIAECGRCGRRLVIHAKAMCEHCYKQRFRNPNAKLRPDLQRIKSIEPVEIIVEQPKEPTPAPRVDSAATTEASGVTVGSENSRSHKPIARERS